MQLEWIKTGLKRRLYGLNIFFVFLDLFLKGKGHQTHVMSSSSGHHDVIELAWDALPTAVLARAVPQVCVRAARWHAGAGALVSAETWVYPGSDVGHCRQFGASRRVIINNGL